MSVLRGCILGLIGVALVLSRDGQGQPKPSSPANNKVIIYPVEGDSIESLKQRGIDKVDHYGSYWLVRATDEQVVALEKLFGSRAVKANYLNRVVMKDFVIDTTTREIILDRHQLQNDTWNKRLCIIQFAGPMRPGWLDLVKAAADVRFVSYVPNNAYIAWLDYDAEGALRNLIAPLGPIQWIGDYEPRYRVSRDLRNTSGADIVKVRVAAVEDSQDWLTADRLRSCGIITGSFAQNGQRILRMDVLPSAIRRIAELPGVLTIEKVHPKVLLDEVQDLIVTSQTNGLGHGPSAGIGIADYLDFLTNTVGGGLASFTNQFTYPIVDVADTGFGATFEEYPFAAVQPSFNEFGSTNRIVSVAFPQISRVAYLAPQVGYFNGATKDAGCERLNDHFIGTEDFYDHGTRVASVIAGFDTQTNDFELCIYSTIVTQIFTDSHTCGGAGNETQTFTFATSPCALTTDLVFNCTSAGRVFDVILPLPTRLIVTQGVDNIHRDASGFHLGLGVSPFGRIGSSRIWRQDADTTGTPPRVRFLPPGQPLVGCMEDLYTTLFNEAYGNGARIQNNSWAHFLDQTGSNGGIYDMNSQIFDTAVRDALLVGTSNNIPGPFPLNQEFIIVFAGNSRLGDDGASSSLGGFGDIRVTSPATGKNVITVGSSESVRFDGSGCDVIADRDNSFDIWERSAFGPTLDGRFKPEIVAPGTTIWAAKSLLAAFLDSMNIITPAISLDACGNLGSDALFGCLSTNLFCRTNFVACLPVASADIVAPNAEMFLGSLLVTNRLYDCSRGSSYAAPAVSGAIQLLWWYFQNRLTNELGTALLQPSPAMAKAYLCNSARYLPLTNPQTGARDTLPSVAQGMGILDLKRMFDGVPRIIRDESSPRAIDTPLITTNPAPQQTYFSQSGQSYELNGVIADSAEPFRVTLAWLDTPGETLVNDLDLQVTVSNTTYKGNVFFEDRSVPGGAFDSINNMESVFLTNGQVSAGTQFKVVIRAANIAGDGVPNVGSSLDQDFALVVYNGSNPSDVPNVLTNDSCQTAISIPAFPFSFTNNLTKAVYHNTHPSPTAARGGAEEFFKVELPTAGTQFTINTSGSRFTTLLSVWRVQLLPQNIAVRSPCGALVELTSNASGNNSQVSFTADGSNTYYIIVEPQNDGSGGQMVLNVSASGLPVSVTPTHLDFGSVISGTTGAVQTVTYNNSSSNPVLVSDVSIQGANASDFAIVDQNCSGNLIPAHSNCTIRVAFAPTASGTQTAELVITDDLIGSPRVVLLDGEGLPQAPFICASAANLSFGSSSMGSTSNVQSVTITNCGTDVLHIFGISLTGPNAGEFTTSGGSCSGQTVDVGATCSFGVTFAPTNTGLKTASVVISNDTPVNTRLIALGGTGVNSQPDSLISKKRKAKSFIGRGIINTTGAAQEIVQKGKRGKPRVFYVNVVNAGNNTDSFKVQGNNDEPGLFTVKYFLGAVRSDSVEITGAAKSGSFSTGTLAAGASTSDATMLRIEVTPDRAAPPGTYSVLVTTTSGADLSKSDSVKATVSVK
jgi:hypothetical protein